MSRFWIRLRCASFCPERMLSNERRHFVLFAIVTFTHYACRRDRDLLRGQAKWQQKEEEKIVECFVPSHIAGYVNGATLWPT